VVGGRRKAKGKRQKAKGRRQKAEGKRQKAKGKRQKAKGRRQKKPKAVGKKGRTRAKGILAKAGTGTATGLKTDRAIDRSRYRAIEEHWDATIMNFNRSIAR
jgi:hypothetical protein